MEIRVHVIQHLAEQSGTGRNGNAWTKREFVGETYDQYPRKIVFTIFNRKDDIPQLPDVGSDILVDFDLESNSWNTRDGQERWSTTVKVFAIKPGAEANPTFQQPQVQDASLNQPSCQQPAPVPQYQQPAAAKYQHPSPQQPYMAAPSTQVSVSQPSLAAPVPQSNPDDLPF